MAEIDEKKDCQYYIRKDVIEFIVLLSPAQLNQALPFLRSLFLDDNEEAGKAFFSPFSDKKLARFIEILKKILLVRQTDPAQDPEALGLIRNSGSLQQGCGGRRGDKTTNNIKTQIMEYIDLLSHEQLDRALPLLKVMFSQNEFEIFFDFFGFNDERLETMITDLNRIRHERFVTAENRD